MTISSLASKESHLYSVPFTFKSFILSNGNKCAMFLDLGAAYDAKSHRTYTHIEDYWSIYRGLIILFMKIQFRPSSFIVCVYIHIYPTQGFYLMIVNVAWKQSLIRLFGMWEVFVIGSDARRLEFGDVWKSWKIDVD